MSAVVLTAGTFGFSLRLVVSGIEIDSPEWKMDPSIVKKKDVMINDLQIDERKYIIMKT